MYQIIIGKQSFNNGPIVGYYNEVIESEVLNMSELSAKIIEGLKANINLLVDSALIDSLATSGLSTIYDLHCLQYVLLQSDVVLLVTSVETNVVSPDVEILVKVISPINDNSLIPVATDYVFNDKIDFISVIEDVNQTRDLFDPSVFINSPISELLDMVPDLDQNGVPTTNLVEQGLGILSDLGFNIKTIYFNA